MTEGNIPKLKLESMFGTLSLAPISMSTFIGKILLPYLFPLYFTSYYIWRKELSVVYPLWQTPELFTLSFVKGARNPNQMALFSKLDLKYFFLQELSCSFLWSS